MSHLCSIPFLCSQTNFFQTSIEEKKVSLEWKELSTASLLAQIVLSPQKFSVSCLHERILLAAVLNLISKNYFKVITSRMRNCNTLTCSTSICLTYFFWFCLGTLQVAKYSVTPYPVMLKLMATETPLISLQPDSFTLEIQGSMEVFAVLPDSTTQSLFTMNIVSTRNKMTFN